MIVHDRSDRGVLEQQRVQGVLITPVDNASPHLDRLRAHGIPVVLVDHAGRQHQCSVAVDDKLGGRVAVDHLLERGHRRIAFVGGPFSIQQVADRHRGARGFGRGGRRRATRGCRDALSPSR